MSTFNQNGEEHPIILISLIDEIEITSTEFVYVIVMVLAVVTALILIFGSLLLRLSQRLIEPVSALKV
ncbi:hypothetical protein OFN60_39745, partial [Escherichia coli]|nr:hypothetical protein [Escherichia coli]